MWGERLSNVEYRLLCRAVVEACRLAGSGDPLAGCRCLASGLERASEFAASGERWAADLERSYLVALDEYAALRLSRWY